MYLVAVLDWYSRYVVAWELDETLELPFVLNAVDRALACAVPSIFNSDQGSHFTSGQYTSRLLAAGTRISMDGRGRAFDNIFVERLWRTIKYEEVVRHEVVSVAVAHPKGYDATRCTAIGILIVQALLATVESEAAMTT